MSIIRSNSNSSGSALAKWWAERGLKTSIDVIDRFKFYKFNLIEYGNWINQDLRNDVSLTILKGCAEVLLPLLKTKNLGIDNSINIAIGSRGKKGSLAYFQPSTLFLSFNKYRNEDKGELNKAFSFTHEYFHALDYIIGRYIEPNKFQNMLSDTWNISTNTPIRQAVRVLMSHFYDLQESENKNWLKGIRKVDYWGSPAECFARLSEQCVSYYAYQKKIKQGITKPVTFYIKHPNVYMPKQVMVSVYPYWLKVVELFSLVLQGKSDTEIQKVANKTIKKTETKTVQGSLFSKNNSKKKTEKTKKKSPNSKKKTTKTKKK